MIPTNRHWLPKYCDPTAFLPDVQETRMVFSARPYLFQDFVAKAMGFLRSAEARAMGFHFDPARTLPCKWKCSDEAVFGVDLILYAFTGQFPFDKGKIGGRFNEQSVNAAVHHAPINIDFGGSHVGYRPGPGGGSFGRIGRPLHTEQISTDCGALMALVGHYQEAYDDACDNILVFRPTGGQALVSIPNEHLQPSWSTQRIKLLVDLEELTVGVVPYDAALVHTHKVAARSLFRLHPHFVDRLSEDDARRLLTPTPTPIDSNLTADFFNIFDTMAELEEDGVPKERLLPYMKRILTAPDAPPPLKVAQVNTNLEYNRLTDCLRQPEVRPYSFACFTGVFIDMYDAELGAYVNLFQPVGMSIKAANQTRELEVPPAAVHELFDRVEAAAPVLPLAGVLGRKYPEELLEKFTFRPGFFSQDCG
ncbi:MAG: hypothetical protein KKI08_11385 [Armatimonadetes bacterium]|nr:hypothetical protein [Armatimonadota bacterium]